MGTPVATATSASRQAAATILAIGVGPIANLAEQLGTGSGSPAGWGSRGGAEALIRREVEADEQGAAHRGRGAVGGASRGRAFHAVEEAPLCLGSDEAVEAELAAEVVVQRACGHPGRGRHLGDVDGVEASLSELLERAEREPALGRRRDRYPLAHVCIVH